MNISRSTLFVISLEQWRTFVELIHVATRRYHELIYYHVRALLTRVLLARVLCFCNLSFRA